MTFIFECHREDYSHITQYFRNEKNIEIIGEITLENDMKEFAIEYNGDNEEDFIKRIICKIRGIDEATRRGFKVIYPTTSVFMSFTRGL